VPALPELMLVFGSLTVIAHLFAAPSVLSVTVQVGCMVALALMSTETKTYFVTRPKVSVVLLFIPLSMLNTTLNTLTQWLIHRALSDYQAIPIHQERVLASFEIRGSMVLANVWEEMLRLGTYLSGLTTGWASGLLWAVGHTLPEAARPGKVGLVVPIGQEHAFNVWVGLGFILALTVLGAILLYVLRVTQSFWNVLLIHLLINIAGFNMMVGSTTRDLFIIFAFLVLGTIWTILHLRYITRQSNVHKSGSPNLGTNSI
jgi:hypothetical protein